LFEAKTAKRLLLERGQMMRGDEVGVDLPDDDAFFYGEETLDDVVNDSEDELIADDVNDVVSPPLMYEEDDIEMGESDSG
jgi:hypothetical protein